MAQKKSKNLKKLIIALSLSAIAVTFILNFGNFQKEWNMEQQNLTAAESMENLFYDQFFKRITEVVDTTGVKDGVVMEMEQYNDPNILIGDIDEKSLEKLGNYYEWDRSIHAKVIENLSEGGAAAISFDILFKNADFGKRKADQCNTILSELHPDTSRTDSIVSDIFSQIRSAPVTKPRECGIVCAVKKGEYDGDNEVVQAALEGAVPPEIVQMRTEELAAKAVKGAADSAESTHTSSISSPPRLYSSFPKIPLQYIIELSLTPSINRCQKRDFLFKK